ncbi:MAG: glycoside hydrolase family 3 C-terminal domain-containing protein [Bacilli bacterium]|nr:glycoside hydrolase family 3 C-terminal domain-containing protein [Bacilli bacterium]
MGKFNSLSGKEKTRLIVSIASLPLIVAAGVALGIGNGWAFGDGASTLTTYLTKAAYADEDAMTRSTTGMGDELAVEVEGEGIVMLENNGTLPLDKADFENKKICVFGHGSVDWYIMSSGSEMVGTKGHKAYDLVGALKKRGLAVNQKILDYYSSWHKAEGDSNTIMSALDDYFVIREPSLEVDSKYREIYDDALDRQTKDENDRTNSDTAIFVISRHAGENSDCPHYQNKLSSNNSTHTSGSKVKDESRTYLEISQEEEDTLKAVAADFENVIVIENSTNNMTFDFVKRINEEIPNGIDAVLNVGVTGGQGALAIPDVVFGDVTPSGHMTDTTPYRPEYNITYYRSCAKHTRHYTGGRSSDFFSKAGRGSGGAAFYNYACYSEYTEGIYMGYRWFETADAEGFWEPYGGYDNVVQYPFGYGMSYTDFSWKFVEANKVNGSEIEADEKLNFKVEVTNTGDYKGKDVVQIYLTAPYTPGGIEKSFRKLVGYEKTPLLEPGESATIDIEVDTKDFKSYDDYDANKNGHTGYELEAGDYVLNFMTDAHHVKENVLPLTYKVSKYVPIDKDEVTGETVENRFTGETAYEGMPIDGSSVDQDIEFVHRDHFPALLTDCEPDKPWTDKLMERASSPGELVANYSFNRTMGDNWDNADKDYFGDPIPEDNPTWNSKGDLKLFGDDGKLTDVGRACGADYDAEEWNGVLDQLDFGNSKTIVTENSSYAERGMSEIGLRDSGKSNAFKFEEGAAMIGGGYGQSDSVNCPAYPGPTMGCQAWNRALTFKLGKSMGNDMNASSTDGIFSPNCNLHRSTYGGRNCGYQSEDPILSGRYVSEIIKGISIYGRITFVKHFVANDQDFNRMANMTWMTEQTFRELYLRSFEEAVKNGGTVGIMTSFNRVGGIWAGGNEALIQGVLRREWGFRGQIITDMTENGQNMDIGFSFRCGGNINLIQQSHTEAAPIGDATTTPTRVQWRMREAMHQIAYSFCNAMVRHENYNASADPSEMIVSIPPKNNYLWWQPAIISLDAFALGGLLIGGFACVLNIMNIMKNGGEEAEENE